MDMKYCMLSNTVRINSSERLVCRKNICHVSRRTNFVIVTAPSTPVQQLKQAAWPCAKKLAPWSGDRKRELVCTTNIRERTAQQHNYTGVLYSSTCTSQSIKVFRKRATNSTTIELKLSNCYQWIVQKLTFL